MVNEFSNTINIIITGDFCPINRIKEFIENEEYSKIFNEFLPIIRNADMAITNLECPLIENGVSIDKTGPCLKAPKKTIEALKFAGFDLITLANNHIMDYGVDGLNSTFECCHRFDIAYVGAGSNLEKARKPFCVDIKGKRIAIINFCENEWSTSHGEYPGANPLNPVSNFYQIKKAKSNAEHVIVIVHGGHEHYNLPSPRMKETYRFFIDAGASAVIGHHTHCYSGYEIYNKSPIFYSLGNFIFDFPEQKQKHASWAKGFAVEINITQQFDFKIIPFAQNLKDTGIQLMGLKEKNEFDNDLKRINEILIDDKVLSQKFNEYCRKREGIMKLYIEPYPINFFTMALRNKNLLPSLISLKNMKYLRNIVQCESHRDVLLKFLSSH